MPRWKLVTGVHSDQDAILIQAKEIPGAERGPGLFYAGDVFDSDKDLSHFNIPGSVRFEKLADDPDDLDRLTMPQLKTLAGEEEIEVPSNLRKPDLIKAIRSQLSYRAAVGAAD